METAETLDGDQPPETKVTQGATSRFNYKGGHVRVRYPKEMHSDFIGNDDIRD